MASSNPFIHKASTAFAHKDLIKSSLFIWFIPQPPFSQLTYNERLGRL